MSASGHLFAEHTSRYDLRCTRCGVQSIAPDAARPCPSWEARRERDKRPGPFGDPTGPAWRRGEKMRPDADELLVEMACCAFRFSATHTNASDDGYTCPMCEPRGSADRGNEPHRADGLRLERNDAYAGGWVLIDEGDRARFSIALIRELAAANRAAREDTGALPPDVEAT